MWPSRATLLLAALAVACSGPARPAELARAEHLRQDGQDAEAFASYDAAARSCKKIRDRSRRIRFCAEALAGRAETLEAMGREEDAADAWELIPKELPDSPEDGARGLHEAAMLRLRMGQDKAAYDLFWKVILEFPDETAAEDALRVIVRDGRRRNARQLDEVLAKIYPRLQHSELADNLLYDRADLAEHELADPKAALDLLDEVAARYADRPLYDDALWHGARLARAAGDPKGALRRLKKLLKTRSKAYIVGSYLSVWLDDAQLETGLILRDDLGDLPAAAVAFALLPQHYPDSILRDDALWELAVTREQQGDVAGACKALASLKKRYPDSKHELSDAPDKRAALGCKLQGR